MAKPAVKKILTGLFVTAAVLVLASAVLFDAFGERTVERSGFAMGSPVSVKLYGTHDAAVADEILSAVSREEDVYISRSNGSSELCALNQNGSAHLSAHTADILARAFRLSVDSGGAFDVTVGRLTALWNFDAGGVLPSESELAAALATVGSEKAAVDGTDVSLGDGQTVDLGALGKGVGCDDAAAILKERGIDGATVSVGGSVLVYGKNPDGGSWTVGVRTPAPGDNSLALRLTVDGTAFLSTSGDYEKFFVRDGVTYHHILSPQTGMPASSGLKSVTVVSDSGLLSDALSTACFILGLEGSGQLLERYGADAVFIDRQDRVFVTDGLFDKCAAETDAYTIEQYEK